MERWSDRDCCNPDRCLVSSCCTRQADLNCVEPSFHCFVRTVIFRTAWKVIDLKDICSVGLLTDEPVKGEKHPKAKQSKRIKHMSQTAVKDAGLGNTGSNWEMC